MRVVVVGNEGDDDDGVVGELLEEPGAKLVHLMREDTESVAGADEGADAVVLLGSDRSVYDPAVARPVAAEMSLIERAGTRGVPVMAICYGAQVAARTVGMTVSRSDMPEIGWVDVETSDDRLCPPGPWFAFHYDAWTESESVPHLARTAAGPQAFSRGRLLAVQFHPEVTPDMALRWLSVLPPETGIDLEAITADTHRFFPAARISCRALVDAFLEDVAYRD